MSNQVSVQVQTQEALPRKMKDPITEEDKQDLEKRYANPGQTGHFQVYFGKFKGMSFAELYDREPKYCGFISHCSPLTKNMYLFQRYFRARKMEATLPQEARKLKKSRSAPSSSKKVKPAIPDSESDSE